MILKAPEGLLAPVRKSPSKFPERALYELFQISILNFDDALSLAIKISLASGDPGDEGVSVRELEAYRKMLQDRKDNQGREQQSSQPPAPVAMPVANASGKVGAFKLWPTGRFEFRPEKGAEVDPDFVRGLAEEMARRLQEHCKSKSS
jgi:hypothetical protein